MIMQTQPIYDCFMSLCEEIGERPHLIYMSPQGKTLTQERVKELAEMPNIAILCGRYEGVDQRVSGAVYFGYVFQLQHTQASFLYGFWLYTINYIIESFACLVVNRV